MFFWFFLGGKKEQFNLAIAWVFLLEITLKKINISKMSGIALIYS